MHFVEKKFGGSADRWNYLVHVDDRRKIAYFETPKVACTSLKKYMQNQYVGHDDIILENVGDVHNRELSPLRRLTSLSSEEAERVFYGDYRRFTFLRNPFTRILSAYLDKIVMNEWERGRHLPKLGFDVGDQVTFSQFLERIQDMDNAVRDIHFASQSSLILAGDVEMSYVGFFECFKPSFARMKQTLYGDARESALKKFGTFHATGASERIAEFYFEDDVDVVLSIFDDDFANFGYSRDIYDAM